MPSKLDPLLRRAVPSDATGLVALRVDALTQNMLMANHDLDLKIDPLAATQAWIVRREAASWFRIIDCGGGPVGFAQIADIHHSNGYGWLGLALAPEARGRGLGAKALSEVETAATRDCRLHKLLLQVRVDNSAALRLYDRNGWRQAGLFLEHYYAGVQRHDVFILEKVLI